MKIAINLADYAIGTTLSTVYGQDCLLWNSERLPIYDLLDEFKPDFIMVDIKAVSPIFIQAVNEYKTKVVIYGSGVPDGLEPALVCAKASTSTFIRRHIESSAKQVIYQKDCANIPFEINPKMFSRRNVGHVSVNMGPEAIKRKIEALSTVTATKSVVGERISVEYYLGRIKLNEIHSYIAANDIYVDFDEVFLLDGAALGKYVISPQNNALFSLFSVDSLGEKCNNILEQSTYKEEAKEAQLKVWQADTCFHRVVEVLDTIGAPEAIAAKKLLEDRRQCALAY